MDSNTTQRIRALLVLVREHGLGGAYEDEPGTRQEAADLLAGLSASGNAEAVRQATIDLMTFGQGILRVEHIPPPDFEPVLCPAVFWCPACEGNVRCDLPNGHEGDHEHDG